MDLLLRVVTRFFSGHRASTLRCEIDTHMSWYPVDGTSESTCWICPVLRPIINAEKKESLICDTLCADVFF